jgi:RNA polymerase sigma factor (sigma-70 family)
MPHPSELAANLVLRIDTRRAIALLGTREQRALQRWRVGYTEEEIAAQFKVSQPTVSRLLSDARAKLADSLAIYKNYI